MHLFACHANIVTIFAYICTGESGKVVTKQKSGMYVAILLHLLLLYILYLYLRIFTIKEDEK